VLHHAVDDRLAVLGFADLGVRGRAGPANVGSPRAVVLVSTLIFLVVMSLAGTARARFGLHSDVRVRARDQRSDHGGITLKMKRSILKAFCAAAASLFSYSRYAASPGRELSDFNGIHLESLESDLPSKYTRLFEPSDCKVDKGARINVARPVRSCHSLLQKNYS